MIPKFYNGQHSCADIDRILNEAERNSANIDYIAMMSEIELSDDEPEEIESEVIDNEQEVSESEDVL